MFRSRQADRTGRNHYFCIDAAKQGKQTSPVTISPGFHKRSRRGILCRAMQTLRGIRKASEGCARAPCTSVEKRRAYGRRRGETDFRRATDRRRTERASGNAARAFHTRIVTFRRIRWSHRLLFVHRSRLRWQSMQYCVHGTASRRFELISLPHPRHSPNVPSRIRSSACRMFRRIWRSSALS